MKHGSSSYTEKWDKLTEETVALEYERVGVQPGDHLGYYFARLRELDQAAAARARLPISELVKVK